MNKKDIYLIGFMTSGKTSFGKKLAKSLEYDFLDLDRIIEDDLKMDINAIFKKFGEAFFRQKETECIKQVIVNKKIKNRVVALGGGTVCFNDTLNVLKPNGIIVYLELPLKNIIGRLKTDKQNRPLVKDLNNEDLTKKVSDLFSEREKYYLQADFKIDAQLSKSKMKQLVNNFIENQK